MLKAYLFPLLKQDVKEGHASSPVPMENKNGTVTIVLSKYRKNREGFTVLEPQPQTYRLYRWFRILDAIIISLADNYRVMQKFAGATEEIFGQLKKLTRESPAQQVWPVQNDIYACLANLKGVKAVVNKGGRRAFEEAFKAMEAGKMRDAERYFGAGLECLRLRVQAIDSEITNLGLTRDYLRYRSKMRFQETEALVRYTFEAAGKKDFVVAAERVGDLQRLPYLGDPEFTGTWSQLIRAEKIIQNLLQPKAPRSRQISLPGILPNKKEDRAAKELQEKFAKIFTIIINSKNVAHFMDQYSALSLQAHKNRVRGDVNDRLVFNSLYTEWAKKSNLIRGTPAYFCLKALLYKTIFISERSACFKACDIIRLSVQVADFGDLLNAVKKYKHIKAVLLALLTNKPPIRSASGIPAENKIKFLSDMLAAAVKDLSLGEKKPTSEEIAHLYAAFGLEKSAAGSSPLLTHGTLILLSVLVMLGTVAWHEMGHKSMAGIFKIPTYFKFGLITLEVRFNEEFNNGRIHLAKILLFNAGGIIANLAVCLLVYLFCDSMFGYFSYLIFVNNAACALLNLIPIKYRSKRLEKLGGRYAEKCTDGYAILEVMGFLLKGKRNFDEVNGVAALSVASKEEGNASSPIQRGELLFTGRIGQIHFVGKIIRLGTLLSRRVMVRRELENTLRLTDCNAQENWLLFSSQDKENISITLPELRGRQAQICNIALAGTYKDLSEEAILKEFFMRLFWMKYPDKKINEAVMQGLRDRGIRQALRKRKLGWGKSVIFLPLLFQRAPGIVATHRDAVRHADFIGLEEAGRPDNFVVFLRKKDGIYLLTESSEELVPSETANSLLPMKLAAFRKFEGSIPRQQHEQVRNGQLGSSLGPTRITFHAHDEACIVRRDGAIQRQDEWARDSVIIRNVATDEKITEIHRVGIDEFTIEGFCWPDGRLIIVKTNYINLSTLASKFQVLASKTLRDYFSPTSDDDVFGGEDRLVKYETRGDKIARKGYKSPSRNASPSLKAVAFSKSCVGCTPPGASSPSSNKDSSVPQVWSLSDFVLLMQRDSRIILHDVLVGIAEAIGGLNLLVSGQEMSELSVYREVIQSLLPRIPEQTRNEEPIFVKEMLEKIESLTASIFDRIMLSATRSSDVFIPEKQEELRQIINLRIRINNLIRCLAYRLGYKENFLDKYIALQMLLKEARENLLTTEEHEDWISEGIIRRVEFNLSIQGNCSNICVGIRDHLLFVLEELFKNSEWAYSQRGIGFGNRDIFVLLHDGNNKIVMEVSDKAGGIPVGDQNKLFLIGYTTTARHESSHARGLGLFMSKAMIEFHGGTMEVENMPGTGLKTTVILPNELPCKVSNATASSPIDWNNLYALYRPKLEIMADKLLKAYPGARKYISADELVAAAIVGNKPGKNREGLWYAVESFDPDKGASFDNYANQHCWWAMKRAVVKALRAKLDYMEPEALEALGREIMEGVAPEVWGRDALAESWLTSILTRTQWLAYTLFYKEDKSAAKIASDYRRSKTTVYNHKKRAQEKIDNELGVLSRKLPAPETVAAANQVNNDRRFSEEEIARAFAMQPRVREAQSDVPLLERTILVLNLKNIKQFNTLKSLGIAVLGDFTRFTPDGLGATLCERPGFSNRDTVKCLLVWQLEDLGLHLKTVLDDTDLLSDVLGCNLYIIRRLGERGITTVGQLCKLSRRQLTNRKLTWNQCNSIERYLDKYGRQLRKVNLPKGASSSPVQDWKLELAKSILKPEEQAALYLFERTYGKPTGQRLPALPELLRDNNLQQEFGPMLTPENLANFLNNPGEMLPQYLSAKTAFLDFAYSFFFGDQSGKNTQATDFRNEFGNVLESLNEKREILRKANIAPIEYVFPENLILILKERAFIILTKTDQMIDESPVVLYAVGGVKGNGALVPNSQPSGFTGWTHIGRGKVEYTPIIALSNSPKFDGQELVFVCENFDTGLKLKVYRFSPGAEFITFYETPPSFSSSPVGLILGCLPIQIQQWFSNLFNDMQIKAEFERTPITTIARLCQDENIGLLNAFRRLSGQEKIGFLRSKDPNIKLLLESCIALRSCLEIESANYLLSLLRKGRRQAQARKRLSSLIGDLLCDLSGYTSERAASSINKPHIKGDIAYSIISKFLKSCSGKDIEACAQLFRKLPKAVLANLDRSTSEHANILGKRLLGEFPRLEKLIEKRLNKLFNPKGNISMMSSQPKESAALRICNYIWKTKGAVFSINDIVLRVKISANTASELIKIMCKRGEVLCKAERVRRLYKSKPALYVLSARARRMTVRERKRAVTALDKALCKSFNDKNHTHAMHSTSSPARDSLRVLWPGEAFQLAQIVKEGRARQIRNREIWRSYYAKGKVPDVDQEHLIGIMAYDDNGYLNRIRISPRLMLSRSGGRPYEACYLSLREEMGIEPKQPRIHIVISLGADSKVPTGILICIVCCDTYRTQRGLEDFLKTVLVFEEIFDQSAVLGFGEFAAENIPVHIPHEFTVKLGLLPETPLKEVADTARRVLAPAASSPVIGKILRHNLQELCSLLRVLEDDNTIRCPGGTLTLNLGLMYFTFRLLADTGDMAQLVIHDSSGKELRRVNFDAGEIIRYDPRIPGFILDGAGIQVPLPGVDDGDSDREACLVASGRSLRESFNMRLITPESVRIDFHCDEPEDQFNVVSISSEKLVNKLGRKVEDAGGLSIFKLRQGLGYSVCDRRDKPMADARLCNLFEDEASAQRAITEWQARQNEKLRRNTQARKILADGLKNKRLSVLFICMADVNRSLYWEMLSRAFARDQRLKGIKFSSAGVGKLLGFAHKPETLNASLAELTEIVGKDIVRGFRRTDVDADLRQIKEAGLALAANQACLRIIRKRTHHELMEKVFLLNELREPNDPKFGADAPDRRDLSLRKEELEASLFPLLRSSSSPLNKATGVLKVKAPAFSKSCTRCTPPGAISPAAAAPARASSLTSAEEEELLKVLIESSLRQRKPFDLNKFTAVYQDTRRARHADTVVGSSETAMAIDRQVQCMLDKTLTEGWIKQADNQPGYYQVTAAASLTYFTQYPEENVNEEYPRQLMEQHRRYSEYSPAQQKLIIDILGYRILYGIDDCVFFYDGQGFDMGVFTPDEARAYLPEIVAFHFEKKRFNKGEGAARHAAISFTKMKPYLVKQAGDARKVLEDLYALYMAFDRGQRGADSLADEGLSAVIEVFGKDLPLFWDGLVRLGKRSGSCVGYVFAGFKELKKVFGGKILRQEFPHLLALAMRVQEDKHVNWLFEHIYRDSKEILKGKFLSQWPRLRDFASRFQGSPFFLFWWVLVPIMQELKKHLAGDAAEIVTQALRKASTAEKSSYRALKVNPDIHREIRRILGRGPVKVMIIHDIEEGIGDELIRDGALIQALLDFNPELKIYIMTQRRFLYAHKRIVAFDYGGGVFEDNVAMVVYHRSLENIQKDQGSRGFDKEVIDWLQRISPKIFIQSDQSYDDKRFSRVMVSGRSVSLVDTRDRRQYEYTRDLVLTLGLPLRRGIDKPKAGCFMVTPGEDRAWEELDAKRYWDKEVVARNRQKRPVAYVNLFGGEIERKGFMRDEIGLAIKQVEILIEAGYFVLLQPTNNTQLWSLLADKSGEVVIEQLLYADYRCHMALAPEFTSNSTEHKYFMVYADIVATVEGGVTHMLYHLGRPYVSAGFAGMNHYDALYDWTSIDAAETQIAVPEKFDLADKTIQLGRKLGLLRSAVEVYPDESAALSQNTASSPITDETRKVVDGRTPKEIREHCIRDIHELEEDIVDYFNKYIGWIEMNVRLWQKEKSAAAFCGVLRPKINLLKGKMLRAPYALSSVQKLEYARSICADTFLPWISEVLNLLSSFTFPKNEKLREALEDMEILIKYGLLPAIDYWIKKRGGASALFSPAAAEEAQVIEGVRGEVEKLGGVELFRKPLEEVARKLGIKEITPTEEARSLYFNPATYMCVFVSEDGWEGIKTTRERECRWAPELWGPTAWKHSPYIDGPGIYYCQAQIDRLRKEYGWVFDAVIFYHEMLERAFAKAGLLDEFVQLPHHHANLRIVDETLRFACEISEESFNRCLEFQQVDMENRIKNAERSGRQEDLISRFKVHYSGILNNWRKKKGIMPVSPTAAESQKGASSPLAKSPGNQVIRSPVETGRSSAAAAKMQKMTREQREFVGFSQDDMEAAVKNIIELSWMRRQFGDTSTKKLLLGVKALFTPSDYVALWRDECRFVSCCREFYGMPMDLIETTCSKLANIFGFSLSLFKARVAKHFYYWSKVIPEFSPLNEHVEQRLRLFTRLGLQDGILNSLQDDSFWPGIAPRIVWYFKGGDDFREKIILRYPWLIDVEGIFSSRYPEGAHKIIDSFTQSYREAQTDKGRVIEIIKALLALLILYQKHFALLDQTEYKQLVVSIVAFCDLDDKATNMFLSFSQKHLTSPVAILILAHELVHNLDKWCKEVAVTELFADYGAQAMAVILGKENLLTKYRRHLRYQESLIKVQRNKYRIYEGHLNARAHQQLILGVFLPKKDLDYLRIFRLAVFLARQNGGLAGAEFVIRLMNLMLFNRVDEAENGIIYDGCDVLRPEILQRIINVANQKHRSDGVSSPLKNASRGKPAAGPSSGKTQNGQTRKEFMVTMAAALGIKLPVPVQQGAAVAAGAAAATPSFKKAFDIFCCLWRETTYYGELLGEISFNHKLRIRIHPAPFDKFDPLLTQTGIEGFIGQLFWKSVGQDKDTYFNVQISGKDLQGRYSLDLMFGFCKFLFPELRLETVEELSGGQKEFTKSPSRSQAEKLLAGLSAAERDRLIAMGEKNRKAFGSAIDPAGGEFRFSDEPVRLLLDYVRLMKFMRTNYPNVFATEILTRMSRAGFSVFNDPQVIAYLRYHEVLYKLSYGASDVSLKDLRQAKRRLGEMGLQKETDLKFERHVISGKVGQLEDDQDPWDYGTDHGWWECATGMHAISARISSPLTGTKQALIGSGLATGKEVMRGSSPARGGLHNTHFILYQALDPDNEVTGETVMDRFLKEALLKGSDNLNIVDIHCAPEPGGPFTREEGANRLITFTLPGAKRQITDANALSELLPHCMEKWNGGQRPIILMNTFTGDSGKAVLDFGEKQGIPAYGWARVNQTQFPQSLENLSRMYSVAAVSMAFRERLKACGITSNLYPRALYPVMHMHLPQMLDGLMRAEANKKRELLLGQGYTHLIFASGAPEREEKKNIRQAMRWIRMLEGEHPNIRILFILAEPGLPVKDSGLTDREGVACLRLGTVAPDRMPFWEAVSNCVIVPSREEPFGQVVVQSAGLAPVIISNKVPSDALDVWEGVVELEDDRAAALRLHTTLTDEDFRKRLMNRQVKYVRETFGSYGWEHLMQFLRYHPASSASSPATPKQLGSARSKMRSKKPGWLNDVAYKNRNRDSFDKHNIEVLISKVGEWSGLDLVNLAGRVLIIGFGYSVDHLLLAAESLPKAKIVGVEWDGDAVAQAEKGLKSTKKGLRSRIETHVADARDLRRILASRSVSIVLFSSVLDLYEEDSANLFQFLSESERVLVPDGIVAAGYDAEFRTSNRILRGMRFKKLSPESASTIFIFQKPKNSFASGMRTGKISGAQSQPRTSSPFVGSSPAAAPSQGRASSPAVGGWRFPLPLLLLKRLNLPFARNACFVWNDRLIEEAVIYEGMTPGIRVVSPGCSLVSLKSYKDRALTSGRVFVNTFAQCYPSAERVIVVLNGEYYSNMVRHPLFPYIANLSPYKVTIYVEAWSANINFYIFVIEKRDLVLKTDPAPALTAEESAEVLRAAAKNFNGVVPKREKMSEKERRDRLLQFGLTKAASDKILKEAAAKMAEREEPEVAEKPKPRVDRSTRSFRLNIFLDGCPGFVTELGVKAGKAKEFLKNPDPKTLRRIHSALLKALVTDRKWVVIGRQNKKTGEWHYNEDAGRGEQDGSLHIFGIPRGEIKKLGLPLDYILLGPQGLLNRGRRKARDPRNIRAVYYMARYFVKVSCFTEAQKLLRLLPDREFRSGSVFMQCLIQEARGGYWSKKHRLSNSLWGYAPADIAFRMLADFAKESEQMLTNNARQACINALPADAKNMLHFNSDDFHKGEFKPIERVKVKRPVIGISLLEVEEKVGKKKKTVAEEIAEDAREKAKERLEALDGLAEPDEREMAEAGKLEEEVLQRRGRARAGTINEEAAQEIIEENMDKLLRNISWKAKAIAEEELKKQKSHVPVYVLAIIAKAALLRAAQEMDFINNPMEVLQGSAVIAMVESINTTLRINSLSEVAKLAKESLDEISESEKAFLLSGSDKVEKWVGTAFKKRGVARSFAREPVKAEAVQPAAPKQEKAPPSLRAPLFADGNEVVEYQASRPAGPREVQDADLPDKVEDFLKRNANKLAKRLTWSGNGVQVWRLNIKAKEFISRLELAERIKLTPEQKKDIGKVINKFSGLRAARRAFAFKLPRDFASSPLGSLAAGSLTQADKFVSSPAWTAHKLVEYYGQRFTELCNDRKHPPAPVPGAVGFIWKISGSIPIYLASGNQLSRILCELRRNDILSSFDNLIYDAKYHKINVVRRAVRAANGKRVIMFGDARHDMEVARLAGAKAVARVDHIAAAHGLKANKYILNFKNMRWDAKSATLTFNDVHDCPVIVHNVGAMVFDLDGTLISSIPIIDKIYKEMGALVLGVPVDELGHKAVKVIAASWRKYNGFPERAGIQNLLCMLTAEFPQGPPQRKYSSSPAIIALSAAELFTNPAIPFISVFFAVILILIGARNCSRQAGGWVAMAAGLIIIVVSLWNYFYYRDNYAGPASSSKVFTRASASSSSPVAEKTNYSERRLNRAVFVMALNGALTAILLKIALPALGGTIAGSIVFGFNLLLMILYSLFVRTGKPGITHYFRLLTGRQKGYYLSIIGCNIIGSLFFYHAIFANSVSAIVLGFAFILINIFSHLLNVLFLGGKMSPKNKIGAGITLASVFWIMVSGSSGLSSGLPLFMVVVSMLFLGTLPFLKKKLFNSLAKTHPAEFTRFFSEEGIIQSNYLFGFIAFMLTFWVFGSGLINPAVLSVAGFDLVSQISLMQSVWNVLCADYIMAICTAIAAMLFISIWLIDLKALSTPEKDYRLSNYLIIGSLRATLTAVLSCAFSLALPPVSVVIAVIVSLFGAWYGSSNNTGVLKVEHQSVPSGSASSPLKPLPIFRVIPLQQEFFEKQQKQILALVNLVPQSNWRIEQLIERMQICSGYNFAAIAEDNELIGILLAYPQARAEDLDFHDNHIFIRRICVMEALQSRHVVGMSLVKGLIELCEERKQRYLVLQTGVSNKNANAFWQAMGFKKSHTIETGGHIDNIYVADLGQEVSPSVALPLIYESGAWLRNRDRSIIITRVTPEKVFYIARRDDGNYLPEISDSRRSFDFKDAVVTTPDPEIVAADVRMLLNREKPRNENVPSADLTRYFAKAWSSETVKGGFAFVNAIIDASGALQFFGNVIDQHLRKHALGGIVAAHLAEGSLFKVCIQFKVEPLVAESNLATRGLPVFSHIEIDKQAPIIAAQAFVASLAAASRLYASSPTTETEAVDDFKLIDQALARDQSSYALLVLRYRERIYSAVRGILRNRADTEEIVMETFIHAFDALANFHREATFYTFLYRIATNLSFNRLEQLGKLRSRVPFSLEGDSALAEIQKLQVGESDPYQALVAAEERELTKVRVREALEKLSSVRRDEITLCHFDGLSSRKISAQLGLPLGTIQSGIYYARKQLRKIISDNNGSSPLAVITHSSELTFMQKRKLSQSAERLQAELSFGLLSGRKEYVGARV
ncbi:MAG: sigma-70 family RNA polymerase sigma factor [Candidatus Omnitrophica bacterium]|nr:sigma-70 family RNA polymerase sigma factor [Candidatus Omnitrophota bacterium]